MTAPGVGEFRFESGGGPAPGGVVALDDTEVTPETQGLAPKPFPDAVITISDEQREQLLAAVGKAGGI